MAARAAAAAVALLAVALGVPEPAEVPAASPAEALDIPQAALDAEECTAGAAEGEPECGLSLRQLRGELKAAAVKAHGHERAGSGAAETTAPEAAVAEVSGKRTEPPADSGPSSQAAVAGENKTSAVTYTGSCSAADEAAMAAYGAGNRDGTFPKIMSDCGHGAYRWFRFHKDRMQRCIVHKIGISSSCAACFADSGQYGFDHCKLECLFGSWCSHSCLGCTAPNNDHVKSCAGVVVPTASYC